MKGCRTEEDIKGSMRNYFRKQREKQKQHREGRSEQPITQSPQSNQPQQQSAPPQVIYTQPQSQPVQQQQPPIIIQQPAQQQQQPPVIIQQQPQQPIYSQRRRKSLLSRVAIAIALTGVLVTGIWLYQGGLELAVQNWTGIFYTIKNFFQGIIR